MDIRVLNYFLTVAREGTFSAAAEALHMTQPPLSREIKNLEDELGHPLFIRGKRNLTLTEEGLTLQTRAYEIIDLMEKTKAEISASSDDITGEIHIGCAESIAMRVFAEVAANLYKKHPKLRYHFCTNTAETIAEMLEKGLLDFGILAGNANIDQFNNMPLPSLDIWGVLLLKTHPLAKKEVLFKEDLLTLPLFVPKQVLRYNILSNWLGMSSDHLNIIGTYGGSYNAALMVETGIGSSLILSPIHGVPGGKCCFRPLYPTLEARLNVVWKSNRSLSKTASYFLDELKKEIEKAPHFTPYESVEWKRMWDIESEL